MELLILSGWVTAARGPRGEQSVPDLLHETGNPDQRGKRTAELRA